METEYDLCQKQCDELEKILRSLFPWENFLDYPDQRLAGIQTSDLGVQLHHLDIETGDITPPDKPYFLPRRDFPDISNDCKSSLHRDCVLRLLNKDFENQKTDSWIEHGLHTYISLALRSYSFDLDNDIRSKFFCINSLSRYDWIHDWDTARRESQEFHMCVHDEIPHASLFVSRPYCPEEPKKVHSRLIGRNGLNHGWARADIKSCGNDELPSIEEVVVVAGHLVKAADAQRRSVKENPSKTFDRVSPRLVVVVDFTGRCRVLSAYYDGTLHVHFTRILNFQEFTARPLTGKVYLDSIDKEKYFRMMNLILKWTWPIAVGTTHGKARLPVTSETKKRLSEAPVTPRAKISGANHQSMVIRIIG